MSTPLPSAIALSIVIPAYNEAGRIAETVHAWDEETNRLGIVREILVYDDGSTDATPVRLAVLAHEIADVRVTRHPNQGHGPTILLGYRQARGEWVLQIDGDDEVGVEGFEPLWNARERYDLLIGRRIGRRLGVARRLLTLGAALAVRLSFGRGVADVNSPYRLMRRSALVALLPQLPAGMFAPNVALTGLAIRNGWRLFERPVRSRPGAHRPGASWSAAVVGWLALRQLVAVSRRPATATGRSPQRTTR